MNNALLTHDCPLVPALPAPRLELRWRKAGDNWAVKICSYALVLPLQAGDIRRSENPDANPNEYRVELSYTTSQGSDREPIYDGQVETPYRDHSHALWDSAALSGLPIYAVCGEAFTLITDK